MLVCRVRPEPWDAHWSCPARREALISKRDVAPRWACRSEGRLFGPPPWWRAGGRLEKVAPSSQSAPRAATWGSDRTASGRRGSSDPPCQILAALAAPPRHEQKPAAWMCVLLALGAVWLGLLLPRLLPRFRPRVGPAPAAPGSLVKAASRARAGGLQWKDNGANERGSWAQMQSTALGADAARRTMAATALPAFTWGLAASVFQRRAGQQRWLLPVRRLGQWAQKQAHGEGRKIPTPNPLIWSQTRCRCAIPPLK